MCACFYDSVYGICGSLAARGDIKVSITRTENEKENEK